LGFLTAVCADKGSPGATTLAVLLAAAHPNQPILVEADPGGGDLTHRLFAGTGMTPPPGANLLTLAGESRRGAPAAMVAAHAAITPVGVRLVEGLSHDEQQVGLAPLWSGLAAGLVASDHDVIADLGRVSTTHPGLVVAAAAHRIVIVVRPEQEQVVRLPGRIRHLLSVAAGDVSKVLVVVVSPEKAARRDQRGVAAVVAAEGFSAVPVVWFPFAPKEVAAFYAGRVNRRGYLWRAAEGLAAELRVPPTEQTEASAASKAASAIHLTEEAAWITS
jgi:hypothetical protein